MTTNGKRPQHDGHRRRRERWESLPLDYSAPSDRNRGELNRGVGVPGVIPRRHPEYWISLGMDCATCPNSGLLFTWGCEGEDIWPLFFPNVWLDGDRPLSVDEEFPLSGPTDKEELADALDRGTLRGKYQLACPDCRHPSTRIAMRQEHLEGLLLHYALWLKDQLPESERSPKRTYGEGYPPEGWPGTLELVGMTIQDFLEGLGRSLNK